MKIKELGQSDAAQQADVYEYLANVGDDDLLKFLRRLPIVVNDTDGPMTMSDLAYEVALWPFVKEAWKKVPGQPGVPSRLLQIEAVYAHAERELARASDGKFVRRFPRLIDLSAFMQVYLDPNDGLP